LTLRRKSLARLALLALLVVGFPGCGDDPTPSPEAGGSGGGEVSPYGPDGALVGAQPGAKQRPNVLFVVCEQLRAAEAALLEQAGRDVEGPAGTRPLPPPASSFAAATTPVPEAGAALASLVTGRLPSRHRVSHADPVPRLEAGFVTLPEILRAQGYATRVFVGNERLRRAASLWQGCDVDPSTRGLQEFRSALGTWIASLPEGTPWFALVVGDELRPPYRGVNQHVDWTLDLDFTSPWTVAQAYFGFRDVFEEMREKARAEGGADALVGMERRLKRTLWQPRDPSPPFKLESLFRDARNVYEGDVRWAAQFVGEFDRMPLPRGKAITLYTSTGGTAFGEHGVLGAGRQLYDEQIRIPFVVEGLTSRGHVKECASLVDVLPTVLDVLGLPPLPWIDGVSLLPVIEGKASRPPVISEEHQDAENTGDPSMKAILVSVRSPKWKYIVRWDLRAGTVVEEAYDLVADPAEQRNLAAGKATVEGVPFDAEMCAAIERVRDGIWVSVDGANATADSPYSQGQRVTAGRPPRCR
jgi:hypothetical protein